MRFPEASNDGTPYPEQCRTTAQAVDPIIQSLNSYNTTLVGETAALIATMAFESGDFKYNVNVSPCRPGRKWSSNTKPSSSGLTLTAAIGPRNMQMPELNTKYAASIQALTAQLVAVQDQLDRVRALLTANDVYEFGSAAWYLKTQCGPDVRQNLASGLDGFKAYVTGCLQTTATAERLAYYERATMALRGV